MTKLVPKVVVHRLKRGDAGYEHGYRYSAYVIPKRRKASTTEDFVTRKDALWWARRKAIELSLIPYEIDAKGREVEILAAGEAR